MSIRTFAHKGVEEIFLTGRSRRIGPQFRQRMSLLLDAIDGATGVSDLAGAHGFHVLGREPVGNLCNVGQWQLAADLSFRTRHQRRRPRC
jgi:plasmid maintenance system killer protein